MEEKKFEVPKDVSKTEKGIEENPLTQEKSLESSIENDTEKEMSKLKNNVQALGKDIESFGDEKDLQGVLEENPAQARKITEGIMALAATLSGTAFAATGVYLFIQSAPTINNLGAFVTSAMVALGTYIASGLPYELLKNHSKTSRLN